MIFTHLFFAVLATAFCLANLIYVLYNFRTYPLVIPVNGMAAVICGFGAFFNFMQIIG